MYALRATLAIALALTLVLYPGNGRPVFAAFHCMRVHAVMAGFHGNGNIQYVELRMNQGGQAVLGGHSIEFFDASGVLKATFTFPAGVSNANLGDSVLIATQEFNNATPAGDADFVFSGANTTASNGGDLLHPVQGTNGLVHFSRGFDNCDPNITVSPGEVDSVAYGSATAHFGTAAGALTGAADQVLRVNNLALTPTDNSTEYALAAVASSSFSVSPANLASDVSTPRNNGRIVLDLLEPASVGGVSQQIQPDAKAVIDGDDGRAGMMVVWLVASGALAAASVGVIVVVRRARPAG